jgi:hypothetical protein
MEPVLSPWTVYLICEISYIGGAIFLLGLILACWKWITGAIDWQEADRSLRDKEEKQAKAKAINKVKFGIGIFAFVSAIACVVPSKNTMIAMYATKYITTDNVTKAIQTGKQVKDEVKQDVIDIIKAITEETKKKESN